MITFEMFFVWLIALCKWIPINVVELHTLAEGVVEVLSEKMVSCLMTCWMIALLVKMNFRLVAVPKS